jgi:hypothetical protein
MLIRSPVPFSCPLFVGCVAWVDQVGSMDKKDINVGTGLVGAPGMSSRRFWPIETASRERSLTPPSLLCRFL